MSRKKIKLKEIEINTVYLLMNIKSLNPFTSLERLSTENKKQEVRSHESSDRDADGRRDQKFQEEKRHLTEEEIEMILSAIKSHSGVKSSNLEVTCERNEELVFFILTDHRGIRVRRLNSTEAWAFTKEQEKQTGRLIDKVL